MAPSVSQFDVGNTSDAETRDGTLGPGESRPASGARASEWLVNVQGDAVVPMTTLQMVAGVRAGTLPENSLVWRVGMHDWSRLIDVPQLRLSIGPQSARAALPRPPQRFAPLAAQAESQRRRDTLPFGFPSVREPVSTRNPVGVGDALPLVTPFSAPHFAASAPEAEPRALAVYDRPAASLTFAESVRDDWKPTSTRLLRPPPKPPAISNSARAPEGVLSESVAGSRTATAHAPLSNSLVPTSKDAPRVANSAELARMAEAALLEDDAMPRPAFKRVALWAALGLAAAAGLFAFLSARNSQPELAAPEPVEPTALTAAPELEATPPSAAALSAPAASAPARASAATAPAPISSALAAPKPALAPAPKHPVTAPKPESTDPERETARPVDSSAKDNPPPASSSNTPAAADTAPDATAGKHASPVDLLPLRPLVPSRN